MYRPNATLGGSLKFQEFPANAVRADLESEGWSPVSAPDFAPRECSDFESDLAAGRTFFYPPRMTTPALPSTVMDWPLWILCVATPVPSTAGTPYSRATMEL